MILSPEERSLKKDELISHLSQEQERLIIEFCNEMWLRYTLSQTAVADCIYWYIYVYTPKDIIFDTVEASLFLEKPVAKAINRFRKEAGIYEKIKAMEISESDYMPAFK